jgi:outer membrane lipoprotein-sorting protein
MMKGNAGLVLVTILGAASSAWAADTIESVEKKLAELIAAHKSIQCKQKSVSDVTTEQMHVKTDLDMTVRYERRPEKNYVSRIEGRSNMVTRVKEEPERKDKTEILTVFDGKFTYILSKNEQMTSAMKQKHDPRTAQNPFDAEAMFRQMHKDFTLKLLPDESVDGKSCWVVEAVPKDLEKMGDMMARSLTSYDKKSGLALKTVVYDRKGRITTSVNVSDIRFDEDIPDDQFEFKAPAGVQVMDMTAAAGSEGQPSANSTSPGEAKPAGENKPAGNPPAAEKPKTEKKEDPAGKAVKGLLRGLGK